MAVQEVLKMGHPILRQVALPVTEFNTPALDNLILDMKDTMTSYDGAGLAAPQIGVSLRVMIFGIAENPRYPEAETIEETILINPEFDVLDESTVDGWEGCLSVPGLRGLVPRYQKIRYRGYDPMGKLIEKEAENFHARVFQHEYDHLNGVLYPQRIVDLENFTFESELSHYIATKANFDD